VKYNILNFEGNLRDMITSMQLKET